MNIARTLILLGVALFLLLSVVRRMRRLEIKERHALVLLLVSLPFLVFAVWPSLMGWVADTLAIEHGTVMLAAVSCFFIIMIIELLSIVSTLERKVSVLAQMIAVLNDKQGLVGREPHAKDEPEQDAEQP